MASSSLATTVGGAEYAERFAEVIAAAFANDALNYYIIAHIDSAPAGTLFTQQRRVDYFLPNIRKKLAAGAQVVEAGSWAGAALWFPPGAQTPPVDRSIVAAPILEYLDKFGEVKARYLGSRRYWYLNLIGRDPKRTEIGVARTLILPFLEKARLENVPAWLEATNDHARDVYSHFGFRVVEEVRIGVGKVDSTGNLAEGGEGVLVYGMIAEVEPAGL